MQWRKTAKNPVYAGYVLQNPVLQLLPFPQTPGGVSIIILKTYYMIMTVYFSSMGSFWRVLAKEQFECLQSDRH